MLDITVNKIIELKHSDAICIKFDSATGKPRALKKAWDALAELIGDGLSGKEVRTKYNSLLAQYKTHLDASKVSGSAPPKWKYWEIFHKSFPKKNETLEMNVMELGGESASCDLEIFNNSTISKSTGKTKPNLKELKMEFLKLSVEKMAKENLNQENFQNKICQLEAKVDNLEGKLDNILEYIKKKKE